MVRDSTDGSETDLLRIATGRDAEQKSAQAVDFFDVKQDLDALFAAPGVR